MQDLIYLAILLVFFAICVAYIRGLDRLVRESEEAEGVIDMSASEVTS